MSRRKKIQDEEMIDESAASIADEVKQEVSDVPKTEYVKKLLPSHWAREDGLDGNLFIYYDRDGIVTREEFIRIKGLVSKKI